MFRASHGEMIQIRFVAIWMLYKKYFYIIYFSHVVQRLIDDDRWNTGGNRTMVAAATIVSMAAAKKAQQNVFVLYHSYNRTILLGFIWILDFHFKIVLVLRRRYLIPIWCNNGKKNVALAMVAPFWFSALTMVARVGDDGSIISGG